MVKGKVNPSRQPPKIGTCADTGDVEDATPILLKLPANRRCYAVSGNLIVWPEPVAAGSRALYDISPMTIM
jgi:hypothetical protein